MLLSYRPLTSPQGTIFVSAYTGTAGNSPQISTTATTNQSRPLNLTPLPHHTCRRITRIPFRNGQYRSTITREAIRPRYRRERWRGKATSTACNTIRHLDHHGTTTVSPETNTIFPGSPRPLTRSSYFRGMWISWRLCPALSITRTTCSRFLLA